MRNDVSPSAPVALPRSLPVAILCAVLVGGAALPDRSAAEDGVRPAVAETAAERLERLRRVRSDSKRDLAERIGLEFCLACGVGDGAAAAERVWAVGYQELPLRGPLSLVPRRPVVAKDLERLIDALPDAGVARLPTSRFAVLGRDVVRTRFGPGAIWMLPSDYALVLEPDPTLPNWVDRPAYIVVRVEEAYLTKSRGERIIREKILVAHVVGGNLLQVLSESAERTITTDGQP